MDIANDLLTDTVMSPPECAAEYQAWEASCRRLIWLTYAAVVTLLVGLPLLEYARYRRPPIWLFNDAWNIPVREDFKGILFGGITILSAVLLGMTGLLGLLYYATITKVSPRYRPGRLFWLLSGFGFLWLLGDEVFGLHEHIGWRLNRAGVPAPPIGQLADLIMPGIPAVVGLTAGLALRKALSTHRARLRFVGIGAVFVGIMVLLGIFPPARGLLGFIIEDGAKVLAGASFFLFYLMAYLDAISHLIQAPHLPLRDTCAEVRNPKA